jgi:hypothetical protein
MYRRTIYNVVSPDSRRRIALQCVDLLLPGITLRQRKKIADRILASCDKNRGHLKEISEARLLDVVHKVLRVNLFYLKGTLEGHKDHRAYFRRHLKILRDLLAEADRG